MPISKYDKYFGGNAAKAKRAMEKKYGPDKGESVFYATMNKKKKEKRGGGMTARQQGKALMGERA